MISRKKWCREYYKKNKCARDQYTRKWAEKNPARKRAINYKSRDKVIRDKREFMAKAKSVPCADCRRVFAPCCMDFDHLPGTKKKDAVARLARDTTSLETLKKEIAKCEVVCACCHRLRTQRRQTK